MSKEPDFKEAMRLAGIQNIPREIIPDGEFYRFSDDGKQNKDGWYILNLVDDVWFGGFGNHKDIDEGYSSLKKGQTFTADQKKEWKKKQKLINEKIELERIRTEDNQRLIAEKALSDWNKFAIVGDSAYLTRKQVDAFDVRYSTDSFGNFIAVPMKDVDGQLWSYQKIYDDGSKRFLSGGRKKGCLYVIGSLENATIVYVAEGYATGASLHMATGMPVLITFDAGNISTVVEPLKQRYPNLRIVICGDDDQWKEENVGRKRAEEAANKYGCSVVFPKFCNTDTNPTDFNDLHCLEGLEEVKKQLEEHEEQDKITPRMKLPPNFSMRSDGLFYEDSRICLPIEIGADTRDGQSENWGRLVRFKDTDQRLHQLTIPMEKLVGDCHEIIALLNSLGLRISTNRGLRQHFLDFLQNTEPNKKVICVPRIGWQKEYFIFPDGSIPETDEIYFQGEHCNTNGFSQSGILSDWQKHIAKPCQGNSRLIFSLSCAFAAPLLPLYNSESGGVNLKGESSIGKSTALAVAASVWGSPTYIQQWKSTGNALEAVAESYNHSLLCLDELGQVDGKEAGEITYMLANGSGKNRLKAKGGLRKKYEWQLLFLSTGEISISDKLLEAGKKVQAGMMARIVDVPADAGNDLGLFDTIHHFKDACTLAIHLKDAANQFYGTPIHAYLKVIAEHKEKLKDCIDAVKEDFLKKYVNENSNGQVKRVAERFTIVAAAGELAIDLGILPYQSGETFDAAATCFKAWLETERECTESSYEADAMVRQVRSFIESHHASHFTLIDENSNDLESHKSVTNLVGYKRKVNVDNDFVGYEFFVFPESMRTEVCKGLDCKQVCKVLHKRGYLQRQKDVSKYTKQQRLPIGRTSIYHLTHTILSDD